MLKRIFSFLLVMGAAINSLESKEFSSFHVTVPVVDMNEYYQAETKQKFIDEVSKAMHEVGFFAVLNPQIDQQALEKAYRVSEAFFSSPIEQKLTLKDPKLNGQRGFINTEKAQTNHIKDFKEYLHIGRFGNLWPTWMDLKTPMEWLMQSLDVNSEILQKAFALAIGGEEDFLVNMTKKGQCLLRPLYYPKNPDVGTFWAAEHTDIDLFTILPMATEEGLQIFHDGQWIDVIVPAHAFIVNGGDKLQNLTNGYFKSSLHRVVAKPDAERYSIVYFIHSRDEDSMSPTEKCIEMTGGVQRYPEATSLELLASRLREINLASPELLQFEKDSGIMERVKALVEAGVAADPVKLTYDIWMKSQ